MQPGSVISLKHRREYANAESRVTRKEKPSNNTKIVKLLGLNFNLNNAIKMKKLCLRLLAQFFL